MNENGECIKLNNVKIEEYAVVTYSIAQVTGDDKIIFNISTGKHIRKILRIITIYHNTISYNITPPKNTHHPPPAFQALNNRNNILFRNQVKPSSYNLPGKS